MSHAKIDVCFVQRTCWSCPAQWEGRTTDGQMVYARYRSGHLQLGVGRTIDEAVRNTMDGDTGFDLELGDGYDGFLSYEQLKAATANVVDWPIIENANKNAVVPPRKGGA